MTTITPYIIAPIWEPIYLQDMTEAQRSAIRNAALRFRKHHMSIVVGWNQDCCMLLHPRSKLAASMDPYQHQNYPSHLELQFTDQRKNTTAISLLGSSHDAVARLASWSWSWPHNPTNRRPTEQINIHCHSFEFETLSCDSLQRLTQNCSCVRFTNCSITSDQAVTLAFMIEREMTLTFCDCVFLDGGSSFFDALEARDTAGGTLKFLSDFAPDTLLQTARAAMPVFGLHSMQRLFEQNNHLDCLKISSNIFRQDANMLLLPFRAQTPHVEYTIYHRDDACIRNTVHAVDNIVPAEFHLKVQDAKKERRLGVTGSADTTDMVLPQLFLRACENSKVEKLGFFYHRPSSSSENHAPACVPPSIQASLSRAIQQNPHLQELTLDCGCTYDWNEMSKSGSLIEAFRNHGVLRTLTFVVHLNSENSLVSSLMSLLQKNRQIEVRFSKAVDSGFTALVWEHHVRSIVVFNRFYRATLALCRLEPFDLRTSVWGKALLQLQLHQYHHRLHHQPYGNANYSTPSLRHMALLLHHHTDLLCLLVNEMK